MISATLPDPDGNPEEGPSSPVYRYRYDSAGNLAAAIDPLGNRTDYAYDDLGRLTTVTGEDPEDREGDDGPVTEYHYDPAGQVSYVIDPLLRRTDYDYDGLGRTKTVTLPRPNPADERPVYHYTYDPVGNLWTETDPLENVTHYAYDNLYRLKTLTGEDPVTRGSSGGPVTEYDYSLVGDLITVTEPLNQASRTPVTTYGYDKLGRMTSVTLPDPDGDPNPPDDVPVYQYRYDTAGNLFKEIDPLNHETLYEYDEPRPAGEDHVAGHDSARAPVTDYVYDVAGQLREVHAPDPAAGVERVTEYEYDELGRRTAWIEPDPDTGNDPGPEHAYDYDAVGNLRFETDPLLQTTEYVYDNLYRLTDRFDPDPDEPEEGLAPPHTSYTYDLVGNRKSLTDPVGNADANQYQYHTTTWFYDDLDRVKTERIMLPVAGQPTAFDRSFEYDPVGNLKTLTDRNGRVTTYDYDNLGRQTHERWWDGQTEVHTFNYGYDLAGRLTSAADPATGAASSYAYQYDDIGRLKQTTINVGTPEVVLARAYDKTGFRKELAATVDGVADFKNVYTPDALGRVVRVDQTSQEGVTPHNAVAEKRADFVYNIAGEFDTIARYKDTDGLAADEVVTSTYTHDKMGRLTDLVYTHHDTPDPVMVRNFSWGYDAASRVVSHNSDLDTEDVSDYGHDNTDQVNLTDYAQQGKTSETFEYDASGNRTETESATYGTAGPYNRLSTDGTYTYQYDPEGNLTARYVDEDEDGELDADDTNVTNFGYDYRNRLTNVAYCAEFGDPADWSVDYVYDAFNRRISRTLDANGATSGGQSTEYYVWDGGNVVLDFLDADGPGATSSPELSTRYLHGPAVDQLLAQEKLSPLEGQGGFDLTTPGEVDWLVADNLGARVRWWIPTA